ncbi:MAG: tyrosine-protein phosphatase, partial [Sarcina sp.]
KNDINIEFFCGQEVYFTLSILDDLKKGFIGTINDSRYMLIEFNSREFDYSLSEIMDIFYELKIKGIVPVIAHPERYKSFQKKNDMINEFIDVGCLFQLNVGSIEGHFGGEAKKLAKVFLKNDIYSFIGSDAHNTGRRNTDIMSSKNEIEELQNKFFAKTIKNSEDLLENREVRFDGKKIKKKFLGLF